MDIVIALIPEKELYDKIVEIKKTAKQLSEKHQYIDDNPHLTLYVGKLKGIPKIRDVFDIQFSIIDWVIFERDAITGKTTLACKLDEESVRVLREFQEKIINNLSKLSEGILDRYGGIVLEEKERKNLEKFGFPYVGEIWVPHFTIASFSDFDKVWEKSKSECPRGRYKFSSLNIYELENEKLKLLKEIPIS